MQRKRILFLFLILMSVTIYLQAQDTSSERNSLKKGAWAMQFGISSNFTLTSFQGTTLSMKYQLSDRAAIRGGITINGSTSNGNSTITGSLQDTSYGSLPGNSSTDAANVSFVLQYLRYMNPSGPIHFYLGLGPSISYSYSHSSSDNSSLNTYGFYDNGQHTLGYWERTRNTSNSHQWGIGLTGVAGVEWFACQWLSIRAEYSDGIQYLWRSSTSTNDVSYDYSSLVTFINTYFPTLSYSVSPNTHNDNSGISKGWSLSSSGVSFGLSVYW